MYRAGAEEPVEDGVIAGFPVRFSGGALPALEGGAKLGAHNEAIYGSLLGLDAATVVALKAKGVI